MSRRWQQPQLVLCAPAWSVGLTIILLAHLRQCVQYLGAQPGGRQTVWHSHSMSPTERLVALSVVFNVSKADATGMVQTALELGGLPHFQEQADDVTLADQGGKLSQGVTASAPCATAPTACSSTPAAQQPSGCGSQPYPTWLPAICNNQLNTVSQGELPPDIPSRQPHAETPCAAMQVHTRP